MYIFHSHQSILLLAEDHLVMVVHVPKVLCYGEAAEAVTRVVKISGPGHTKTIKQGSDVKTLRMSKAVQICSVCVCSDGVVLTCQAYQEGLLLGSDSTGGCTPARPAAQTSTAADSALTLLSKHTGQSQEGKKPTKKPRMIPQKIQTSFSTWKCEHLAISSFNILKPPTE